MKKILLGLGSLTAVVAPIAAVVSCGTDSNTKTESPVKESTNKGAGYVGKEINAINADVTGYIDFLDGETVHTFADSLKDDATKIQHEVDPNKMAQDWAKRTDGYLAQVKTKLVTNINTLLATVKGMGVTPDLLSMDYTDAATKVKTVEEADALMHKFGDEIKAKAAEVAAAAAAAQGQSPAAKKLKEMEDVIGQYGVPDTIKSFVTITDALKALPVTASQADVDVISHGPLWTDVTNEILSYVFPTVEASYKAATQVAAGQINAMMLAATPKADTSWVTVAVITVLMNNKDIDSALSTKLKTDFVALCTKLIANAQNAGGELSYNFMAKESTPKLVQAAAVDLINAFTAYKALPSA